MADLKHRETTEAVHLERAHTRASKYEDDYDMSVGRYITTRIPTLRPPPFTLPPSPFKLLGLLNRQQWLFFMCGFWGWAWDAFDFFSVSLTVTPLAASFNKSVTDITWGLTLVLMVRSIGSITFGLAADRYGRKWPFIANCVLFTVFELATGFCKTYEQFLGCRALFGVAMGGMWGNAAATALEDAPAAARGILSGIFQVAYIMGYLLATVFARAFVNNPHLGHGWRPLYWFGAGPPILLIIFRLYLPETKTFRDRQTVREANLNTTKTFFTETNIAFRRHWKILIYMVLLLAGLNFQSHGTQDLYPTMLTNQYRFSPNAVTVTQVVANLGAFLGGVTWGYLSDIVGRRFSIIFVSVMAGLLLYPYCFTSSHAVIAAAFFEQFFIEGALGVVPIHLLELAPGSLRTSATGTAYQLGNLASSASSTIEAKLGERFPLTPTAKGVKRYDYGKVMCIFTACCLVYDIIIAFVGPEKRGIALDVEHDKDMDDATENVNIDKVLHHDHDNGNDSTSIGERS